MARCAAFFLLFELHQDHGPLRRLVRLPAGHGRRVGLQPGAGRRFVPVQVGFLLEDVREAVAVCIRAADTAPKAQFVAVLQQARPHPRTVSRVQRRPLIDEAACVLRVVPQRPRALLSSFAFSAAARLPSALPASRSTPRGTRESYAPRTLLAGGF
eukprot:scaffold50897_cov31-Phaeocystis_antarctica.AAC.3